VDRKRELEDRGYMILENFMSLSMLEGLRARVEELFEAEGENAGSEFRQESGARRLANLVDKGELFREMIAMPEILEHITAVIGPNFKLSSLNARSANPYSESDQPLHADMGGIPDNKVTGSATRSGYWMISRLKTEPPAWYPERIC